MNQQRKILCIVAAVAAAGVFADRVLLGGSVSGGPQTAAAAASPAPAAPPTPAVTSSQVADRVVAPASLLAPPTTSLAQRLDHLDERLPAETPDAFVASDFWRTQARSEGAPDATVREFDPRAFARRHPLHAIYSEAGQARAMIDGQALRVGQVRDGVTLERIDDRSVVWAGYGVRFRVTLDRR